MWYLSRVLGTTASPTPFPALSRRWGVWASGPNPLRECAQGTPSGRATLRVLGSRGGTAAVAPKAPLDHTLLFLPPFPVALRWAGAVGGCPRAREWAEISSALVAALLSAPLRLHGLDKPSAPPPTAAHGDSWYFEDRDDGPERHPPLSLRWVVRFRGPTTPLLSTTPRLWAPALLRSRALK